MKSAPSRPPEKPRLLPAQAVFFPAAIGHALVFGPLTVLANTGHADLFPDLAGAAHAREMLGGFALALVAGYTLGPLSRQASSALLWAAALAWSGGYLATGVVLARGKPFRQRVARYR